MAISRYTQGKGSLLGSVTLILESGRLSDPIVRDWKSLINNNTPHSRKALYDRARCWWRTNRATLHHELNRKLDTYFLARS